MAEGQSKRLNGIPGELEELLAAEDELSRQQAWGIFVERYSRLLLHAVHSVPNGYDATMDRYAFVLGELAENDYQRLRQFRAGGSARFSTWLVVVARRLCVDYMRTRYGRERGEDELEDARAVRRRLADFIAEELDFSRLRDSSSARPDHGLRKQELYQALSEAIAELDYRDRLLLKLRFQDELTAREIAELMTFGSQFHVYRRLKSVFGILREGMHQRGFATSRP